MESGWVIYKGDEKKGLRFVWVLILFLLKRFNVWESMTPKSLELDHCVGWDDNGQTRIGDWIIMIKQRMCWVGQKRDKNENLVEFLVVACNDIWSSGHWADRGSWLHCDRRIAFRWSRRKVGEHLIPFLGRKERGSLKFHLLNVFKNALLHSEVH